MLEYFNWSDLFCDIALMLQNTHLSFQHFILLITFVPVVVSIGSESLLFPDHDGGTLQRSRRELSKVLFGEWCAWEAWSTCNASGIAVSSPFGNGPCVLRGVRVRLRRCECPKPISSTMSKLVRRCTNPTVYSVSTFSHGLRERDGDRYTTTSGEWISVMTKHHLLSRPRNASGSVRRMYPSRRRSLPSTSSWSSPFLALLWPDSSPASTARSACVADSTGVTGRGASLTLIPASRRPQLSKSTRWSRRRRRLRRRQRPRRTGRRATKRWCRRRPSSRRRRCMRRCFRLTLTVSTALKPKHSSGAGVYETILLVYAALFLFPHSRGLFLVVRNEDASISMSS